MAEYINRGTLKDSVSSFMPPRIDDKNQDYVDGLTDAYILICRAPAADVVERKTGKWILSKIQRQEDIENDNYQYYCSNCGSGDLHAKRMKVPYCWHCGAKMIGGDEDV